MCRTDLHLSNDTVMKLVHTHIFVQQRMSVGNVLVLKFYNQPEGGSVLKQRPEHSLPFNGYYPLQNSECESACLYSG